MKKGLGQLAVLIIIIEGGGLACVTNTFSGNVFCVKFLAGISSIGRMGPTIVEPARSFVTTFGATWFLDYHYYRRWSHLCCKQFI